MAVEEIELQNIPFSYTYSGPYESGIEVANHYGFQLIQPVRGAYTLRNELGTRHPSCKDHYIDPVHKILIHDHITTLNAPKSMQHMICHTRNPKKKDAGGISLHIIGNNKSIAEALSIQTALAVLGDYGHKNLIVEINSLGDRIAHKTFSKELLNHYRKHINVLGDCCRTTMKNNPLEVAFCNNEVCTAVRNDAPHPINYLNEQGREHFKNIIEYLESLNTAYKINNDLIGEYPDCGTQISFVIKETQQDGTFKVLARGERYNRYFVQNQTRKVPPSVSVSIDIQESGKENYKKPVQLKPLIYLVHLGLEAKRTSLELIELFRQKNIPIAQSLVYDDLGKQIKQAEHLDTKYMIILGVKEARERAVIVRNTHTRAQEVVPFGDLLKYVKKIHRL